MKPKIPPKLAKELIKNNQLKVGEKLMSDKVIDKLLRDIKKHARST